MDVLLPLWRFSGSSHSAEGLFQVETGGDRPELRRAKQPALGVELQLPA